MTQFNANNTNYLDGHYPLFLGQPMGLGDTVNVTYPEIEKLYQDQIAYFWSEFEVDLKQDRMDMINVSDEVKDPMIQTISWQALADSVASRSISSLLTRHTTNPEMESLLSAWNHTEVIHNRTYSHIVKQTFQNPIDMIRDTYANQEVLVRSNAIVKAFDELEDLPKCASKEEIRKGIVKAFTALFALEAIAFMSSFAVTFAITDTGVFQGIGQLVTLICRDECLHTKMDYTILNILKKDAEWVDAIQDNVVELKGILDSVVQQELDWASHVFTTGSIVGLNEQLLQEYVLYLSKPVYDALGVQFDFRVITNTPLKYMDKYVDTSKMQVAPQELNLTAYQVNTVTDDTDDLEFDFDL